MSYGNMNPGLLICRVRDAADKSGIEGARSILTWVAADAIWGGRLPLYDTDGGPDTGPSALTDSSGVAFLEFFWDPCNIAWINSYIPQIHASVVGPAARYGGVFSTNLQNKLYDGARICDQQIGECVNLGQVLNTGSGEFQFKGGVTPWSIAVSSRIKQILEYRAAAVGEKIPKLTILNPMRPTTEVDSLLGAIDVQLNCTSGI